MSKNNFQCLKCGLEFTENKYSISFAAGEAIYKKEGKLLECPECKSRELEFIKEFEGFGANYGRFASASNEDKKKILKKRAKEHSDKRLKERKEYLDRNFTGRTRDVDFQSNA
jgi:DNA-directed RNA polymerase subunit RPC12/RpoP